jgi:hypothetical protein
MSLVSLSFDINGVGSSSIHTGGTSSSSLSSLTFDANEVAEEARTSNLSFKYSGRHDHGPLPLLKSSGVNADLVSALLEAKQQCGEYLTELITKEANGTLLHSSTPPAAGGGGDGGDDDDSGESNVKVQSKKPRIE